MLYLWSGYDTTIRVWNVATGQYIRSMTGHSSIIKSLAAIPPSQSLASASWDSTIKVWNMRSGALLATLEGHTNRVKSVVFHQLSPLQSFLVSGSDDCTLKLWDLTTHTELKTYTSHSQPVQCVAVAEKNGDTIIASGSSDHSVQLFRIEEQLESTQSYLTLGGHQAPVTAVVFNCARDFAKVYSCGEDMVIFVWDCETGYVLHQMQGHTAPCQSLFIYEQMCIDLLIPVKKEFLVSTAMDGSVRIWSTEKCVQENKMSFSKGYLFNAVVGDEAVTGGGGRSHNILVISGDDGCLQMHPGFIENYLPSVVNDHKNANANSDDGSTSSRSTNSLPTIGRQSKTLAVRIPTKQSRLNGMQKDTRGNMNNNVNNNSASHTDQAIAERQTGHTKNHPPGNQLLDNAFEDHSTDIRSGHGMGDYQRIKTGSVGGGSIPIQPPNLPNAQVSSRNNSRNLSRLRAVPSRGVPKHLRGDMIKIGPDNTPPVSRGRSVGSKCGVKKQLPAINHIKKEFICVTSQYTDPPSSISEFGLLNCSSYSSMGSKF